MSSAGEEEVKEEPVVSTPVKRGRKPAAANKKEVAKPQAKRTKRQSESTEEPEANEEPAVSSPRRGRRAAAPKVETPKAKPVRSKRPSESEEPEEEEAGSRPLRSKRKKGEIAAVVASLEVYPVIRLTRCTQPAAPEEKRSSTSSVEDSSESSKKKAPAKRAGRGRAAKAVDDNADFEPVRSRATRGRGKTAAAADSGNSTDDTDSDAKPKSTRRVAAKRNADSLETVPEEKQRRGTKAATPLDDVEMMHEGKGHAADIHANHVVPDEEEEAEKSPPRSTRSKKALRVHFDEAEVPASPARKTRTNKKATKAEEVTPVVLLERDPEIETLLASGAVKEEDEAKTTKRPRQKKTTAVPVESPVVKPAAKRAARGKKATNDPPAAAEPETSPVAVPSPRRTRRTRI